MKKILILLLFITSLASGQMKVTYKFNVSLFSSTTCSYKLYESKIPSKNYLIFFPGRGEVLVGTATEAKLDKVDAAGYTKMARSGYEFPFNIIAVQAYHSSSASSATYSTITRFFIHYVKLYLGAEKIVVTGYSLGGQETYNVQLKALDIKLIDGAVSAAGRPDAYSSADPCLMKDVPMIVYHGDQDNTVPYKQDTTWVGRVNRCPNRVNKIKLVTLKGVGHDSWTECYKPNNDVWVMIHDILKNDEPPINLDEFKSKAIEAITNIK